MLNLIKWIKVWEDMINGTQNIDTSNLIFLPRGTSSMIMEYWYTFIKSVYDPICVSID